MEETRGRYKEIETCFLQIVNRTLAVVKEVHFESDNKMVRDPVKLEKHFKDCQLMAYGGSIWTRIKLLITYPYQRLMKIKFVFHKSSQSGKEDTIYEDALDITFTKSDNKTVTNLFTYEVTWESRSDLHNRVDQYIEVTILNTEKFDNITAAEGLVNLSKKLAEIGNHEDALVAFKTATSISKEIPEAGEDKKEEDKHLDAICNMQIAKDHMSRYFQADMKEEHAKSKVELRKAVEASTLAADQDPDNEDIKELKKLISDFSESVDEFEDGREDQGNAILHEIDGNYEYAIYNMDHAKKKYKAVTDRLKPWDIKTKKEDKSDALDIENLPKDFLEKYTDQLESAQIYLEQMEKLYNIKCNNPRMNELKIGTEELLKLLVPGKLDKKSELVTKQYEVETKEPLVVTTTSEEVTKEPLVGTSEVLPTKPEVVTTVLEDGQPAKPAGV